MRPTIFIAATALSFAFSPAFAAMGGSNLAQTHAPKYFQQAPTLVASPCPPGKVPTGSTSGSNGGCELPAGTQDDGVVMQTNPVGTCPPGRVPTGSTSGSSGGCEAPAGAVDNGVVMKRAPSAPCPPGRTPTGSSNGSNGGCELAPAN